MTPILQALACIPPPVTVYFCPCPEGHPAVVRWLLAPNVTFTCFPACTVTHLFFHRCVVSSQFYFNLPNKGHRIRQHILPLYYLFSSIYPIAAHINKCVGNWELTVLVPSHMHTTVGTGTNSTLRYLLLLRGRGNVSFLGAV